MITREDGTTAVGLIGGEDGTKYRTSATRQILVKDTIANCELQDCPPMPEGLIATPADLRAYVAGLKENK
jgi:hypothetical protein